MRLKSIRFPMRLLFFAYNLNSFITPFPLIIIAANVLHNLPADTYAHNFIKEQYVD